MLDLTPAAARELQAAARRSGAEGSAVRVAARALDDGGIEFGMGFDEPRVDDEELQFDDLTVLVGSRSRPMLKGVVLDFVEIAPDRHGFVFSRVDDDTEPGLT